MMKLIVKRGVHWAGSALAFIGIVFVLLSLQTYYAQIDIANTGVSIWVVVAGFALIYGLANLLLARAWWHLLTWLGANVSLRWVIKVYGTSQLAKYLPGNIFHLVGRHALGMVAGVPTGVLAKSAVWELGLISLSAAIFGALALPFFVDASALTSTMMFVFLLGICAAASFRYLDRNCVWVLFCYTGFLMTSGMLFSALVNLVSGADSALWWSLSGAYVLAWLA